MTALSMDGGFVTEGLRAAFAAEGLDGAMALVEDGLTREQVLAVCEHRARIEGSTRTELVFVALDPIAAVERRVREGRPPRRRK